MKQKAYRYRIYQRARPTGPERIDEYWLRYIERVRGERAGEDYCVRIPRDLTSPSDLMKYIRMRMPPKHDRNRYDAYKNHLFKIYLTVKAEGRDVSVAPFMLKSARVGRKRKRGEENDLVYLFRDDNEYTCSLVAARDIEKGEILKLFSTLQFERNDKRERYEEYLDHQSMVQVNSTWVEETPLPDELLQIITATEEKEKKEEEEEKDKRKEKGKSKEWEEVDVCGKVWALFVEVQEEKGEIILEEGNEENEEEVPSDEGKKGGVPLLEEEEEEEEGGVLSVEEEEISGEEGVVPLSDTGSSGDCIVVGEVERAQIQFPPSDVDENIIYDYFRRTDMALAEKGEVGTGRRESVEEELVGRNRREGMRRAGESGMGESSGVGRERAITRIARMAGPIAWINTAHARCCNVRHLAGAEREEYIENMKKNREYEWTKLVNSYPILNNRDWGIVIAIKNISVGEYLTIDYGGSHIVREKQFRCPNRNCPYYNKSK